MVQPGHVVLLTNGIASTLHASLELARRLVERGHRVTFVSHADVTDTVGAHGHEVVQLVADRDAFVDLRRRVTDARRGSIRAAWSLPSALVSARRRTARADELRTVLDGLEPDVLVIDIEAHVAIVGSHRLGIPTVLTTFLFGVHEADGLPPISSALAPGDDAALRRAWVQVRERNARVRRREAWWTRRGLVARIGPIGYDTTSRVALRAVARRSGFDLSGRTSERAWLRPHTYLDLLTLSTNLWELELEHEAPANWRYVGPMVLTSRSEVRTQADDRERLRRFLGGRATNRPLVYASLGSYWRGDADLLERVVGAFRCRPERDLVIGLGDQFDPARLDPLPPNVLVLRWAPQVEILARCDAAIVHGGNAALNECVVAGVPMLVCSTGHLDQDGIAVRVVHHGVGLAADARRDDAEHLAAQVDRLLVDEQMRARVADLQRRSNDPALASFAVDLIDDVMTGRGQPSAPQTR